MLYAEMGEMDGADVGQVDETAQKNTVLTLYELTESEATISQGLIDRSLGQRDCLLILPCRFPWHGSRAFAEGVECSCEEGKGTSLRPGRSTGCQVLLEVSRTALRGVHGDHFIHCCLYYTSSVSH